MKTIRFIFFIVLVCCHPAFSQNIHWAGVIDNQWNDYVYDLRADRDSNLVITGKFGGTVDFDHGPGTANLTAAGNGGSDIFLAKYDAQGNFLWAHRFGTGFLNDEGDRVAIDSTGNIFLTGMFGSTVDFDPDSINTANISASGSNRARFLAKYDANGNFIAVKHVGAAVGSLPSSQDAQTGLGCDALGNVYMSGFYGTSLTLGPGTTLSISGLSDNYFAKYDPLLNIQWGRRLGSSGTEYSQGMYVYPSGRISVLGSFSNTIDFDPGPGVFNLTQVSNTQDGYFASYDSAGLFINAWQLTAGTSATPIATLIDRNSNILVAGSCAGTMDADPGPGVATIGVGFNNQAFVAAYDSLGQYKWAFAFGDVSAFNSVRYMGVDTAGNVWVSGGYNPMTDIDPGPDTAVFGQVYGNFVASYDTGGVFRTGFLMQEAKIRLSGYDLYLTGGFYGLVDIDPGPGVQNLQSDTLNASWYLVRWHLCDELALSPGTITVPAMCAGDTAVLSVSQGGPQYAWSLPPGFTTVGAVTGGSVTVVVDTGAAAGNVFVQSVGGCSNSPLVYAPLNVLQPPVPVITQVADTLLTDTVYISYQWYLLGSPVAGANSSVYVPAVSGSYTVLVTDSNGCTALSAPYFISLTGIQENDLPFISVYPNPVLDELVIEPGTHDLELEIILLDAIGRVRKSFVGNGNRLILGMYDLEPGMYMVEVRSKKSIGKFKVFRM